MKVYCKRDCENGNGELCLLEATIIEESGHCMEYMKKPEFYPFRADNVVVFDNAGLPSIMVRFSMVTDKELFGGEEKPHPMFVIGGEVYDEIYISKYPNTIINGKAYSLPMQKPAVDVTLEEAEKACFSKGEGWHLLTAAERGFLALLSLKNGTLPHGNTDHGKYHGDKNESGACFDGCKTLVGSGPATWSHDHTVFGVYDLCGNVAEWFRGLRLINGELQVAPDNDAAMKIDLSEESINWTPVKVGEKNIFINCDGGDISFMTDVPEGHWKWSRWRNVCYEFEITDQMKELALFAGEPDAYIFADTICERLPRCGGGWGSGSLAGVFCVNLYNPRSGSNSNLGFRSAYYCKRKPVVL